MGYEAQRTLKIFVLVILGLLVVVNRFAEGSIFGFFLFLGGFVAILLKWKLPAKKVAPPQRNLEHGSAQWATHEEFKKANLTNDNSLIGLFIGAGYLRNKSGHLITIAGSGQGKGTCLIIPNLLLDPSGSYVVTDPKGENACITARAQRDFGQRVIILDPWDEQQRIGAKHGIPSSSFNPFDFLKMDMEELRDNCEQIAALLIPDRPGEKDPYWNDRARALIKVMLMHIITGRGAEEHNFWTLYKMLRMSGKPWIELMLEMKDNEALGGLVSIAAEEFLGMDDSGSALMGIRSSAQNATTIFESPQLRQSLERSDFNPYDLTQGKCTVYIVIPERFLDTHGTWLRLVIGLCLKACNAKPNKRVNFLLDEFAIMGKMKDIQKGYAFARGQNIVLWFFAQSLSQIREIYGEDGMNTFLSNTAVLQAFGTKDQFTKEYISKALGEATRTKKVNSYASSGTSTSYQTFARPLLTPEEVEKQVNILTIVEGLKYMIAKKPYYKNEFEGVPWDAEWLTPEQRKLIKSSKLPKDEWHEHFSQKADPAPRVYA